MKQCDHNGFLARTGVTPQMPWSSSFFFGSHPPTAPSELSSSFFVGHPTRPLMRGDCRPLALRARDNLRDASPQTPARWVAQVPKTPKTNSEKFSSIFQFFNFSAFSAFGTCRNPPKPNFVNMHSLKESYGDGLELEIQTSRPPKNTKRAFLVGGILVRIRRFLMFHLRFPS